MKELIKPSSKEEVSMQLEELSEDWCCGPNVWGGYCDKHCTRGSQNHSSVEEEDILF